MSGGGRHRFEAAAPYLAVATAAVAITQRWFTARRFIASGDQGPFLFRDHAGEYLSLWNHRLSGAGGRTFAVATAPLAWWSAGVRAVGGSDVLAQRLLVTLLLVAIGLGCVTFTRALGASRPVAVAGGLVGLLNPVVLDSAATVAVMTAIALLGFLGAVVLRVGAGARVRPWVFAAMSTALCLVAANPAFLVVVAVWIVIVVALAWALGARGAAPRVLAFLARAGPLVVAVNLWWIVPLVMTIVAPEGNVFSAQTNVRAWAWTQARATVANVLTMTSSWAWAHREYVPWAGRIERPQWAWLRFLLPLGAMSAPLLTEGRRRRASVALLGVLAVAVFVGKGVHGPLGGTNAWLYAHVPGFWLFREPASKVGLIQLMVYVALGALALSGVLRRSAGRSPRASALLRAAPACAVVAIIAYPFPLWTGQVIPDSRPLLPSAHVAVPAAWRHAAAFVNASDAGGKVLVLPLDDFYQMPTTWGYYGADSVVHDLVAAPVISPAPGGYFSSTAGFADIVSTVQASLVDGDVAAVPPLLRFLGVSEVLLRHDLDLTFPGRSFVHPDLLQSPLAHVADLHLARSFGVVDVYTADPGTTPIVQAYNDVTIARPDIDAANVTGIASTNALVTGDQPADGLRWTVGSDQATTPLTLDAPTNANISVLGDQRVRRIDTPSGPALEVAPTRTVAIDGADVSGGPATVPLPPDPVYARVGDTLQEITPTPLVVSANAEVYTLEPAARLGPFGTVGDCNHKNGRGLLDNGLTARRLLATTPPALRLTATSDSACVSAPVTTVGSTPYRLSFEYRNPAGGPARVCVFEQPAGRCLPLPALDPTTSWTAASTAFVPDAGTTSLAVYLYADAPGDGRETVTEYRAVDVQALSRFAIAAPPVTTRALPAGPHTIGVDSTPTASVLGPIGPLSDCNHHDGRTPAQSGLGATVTTDASGPVVELEAMAHSACVAAPVLGASPNTAYRLQLDYRTASGSPARVCLWEDGPNRCVPLPALRAGSGWRHLDATATLDPGTRAARLYLYADGPAKGQTATAYRSLSVTGSAPATVVIRRPGPKAAPPAVSVVHASPSRYRVEIGPANSPFVIGLAESWAHGWHLRGLPRGVHAQHIVLDGYANGWRLSGSFPFRPFTVTAQYAPETVVQVAHDVSAATVFGGALVVSLLAWRRRRSSLLAELELAVSPTFPHALPRAEVQPQSNGDAGERHVEGSRDEDPAVQMAGVAVAGGQQHLDHREQRHYEQRHPGGTAPRDDFLPWEEPKGQQPHHQAFEPEQEEGDQERL